MADSVSNQIEYPLLHLIATKPTEEHGMFSCKDIYFFVFLRGFRGHYLCLSQVEGLRGIFCIDNRPRYALKVGAHNDVHTAMVKVSRQ